MSAITSFEVLDNRISRAGGKPTVLEALWDGDTNGWFLIVSLYTEIGTLFSKKQEVLQLGTVSFGGDIRLFTGEVPAWPEAALMKEWGQKASEKYGLTFYFPSEEPDDDCPDWTRRHLAIHCADCNKLMMKPDSPYLPKDICYPCHLKREQNDRIIKASPCDGGVTLYMTKDDSSRQISYCTHFKDFTIAPFVNDFVQGQLQESEISIVTLGREELIALKGQLETAIEVMLQAYKPPVIEARMKRFVSVYSMTYKDHSYDLMDRSNREHDQLGGLLYAHENVEVAIAGEQVYQFFFKKGITYRDDSMLRFVNYAKEGKTERKEIHERYKGMLTPAEVDETLMKLQKIGCVAVDNDEIRMTPLGQCIL
ncbi:hypothetical protein SAMN05444266_103143 [Chitinophaga jiangningensis]|uniref:Uncharacterized protein n=1 Tax=Chitinophaga jiangningensis TaxID=1419482 RepID=A0A1M7A646_9BACT|nr:hypothetical protein [Chitinophaga jiangningensis]SHL38197.1 hypothetical protein SAMN05444266_103143 [Chitinophaga jiangningensis]